MKKRGRKKKNSVRNKPAGHIARSGDQTLKSFQVGGLPIVNLILRRMDLESLLMKYLPADDPRIEVPTATVLVVLLRNLLMSREPLYGVGEWAAKFSPQLLGLTDQQARQLNDDRVGRCLDRLFDAGPDLVLAVVRHVIAEFGLELDELHNDATTLSFFGAYYDAREEGWQRNKRTLAITWGHSKDRPDLKQLLYTLTITEDGGVPLYFSTDSGNMTDDQTHRETWDLLHQLVGNAKFLYIADSKLATSDNMKYIAGKKGRFITVLPKTRNEDKEFRKRLREGKSIPWEDVLHLAKNNGELLDRYQVCTDELVSAEGFRIFCFHSDRKQESDAAWRSRNLQRAIRELTELREKAMSPRTRYRDRAKVQKAVDQILESRGVVGLLRIEIEEIQTETYKQATRGRPGKDTQYVRQVTTRQSLSWEIDNARVEEAATCDGIFPLITNDEKMSAKDVLLAYKRQPLIEKRFSQFKSDFEVAPVHLHNIARIQALLCVYFFVLMVQALLERELRNAMAATKTPSLSLYPEQRACKKPTTRRVLDLFETIQRHQLKQGSRVQEFTTDLQPVHRSVLRLLKLSSTTYGQ